MAGDGAAEAAASRETAQVPHETRRLIERWFAARGVPQLIEGYSSEQRIDARAVPLIVVWLVVVTGLIWTQRPDVHFAGSAINDLQMAPWAERALGTNVQAMLVALVATGVAIGVVLRVRRHPPFGSPARLDILDIAVLGLAPGIVAAIISGDVGAVPGVATFVLSGVGVIYAVVALGLPELTGWGLRHLRENLPHIATLVARTLPLLLILVVFLLFAAELWQVAHTLGTWDVAAALVLLAIVGILLVVIRAREEIRAIEQRGGHERLADLLSGTPAAGLHLPMAADPPPLQRLERLNLVVLVLVSQLLQSLFVGVMVAVFLVALGAIVVPAVVQEAWAGAPVRDLAVFVVFGERRTVSAELLIAVALLGGTCGLYFTGLALTDATYRAEFNTRVVADIERIMAVRSVYTTRV